MDTVVVGGGLAALRTCEALRREGYDGRLTLVGAEPHRPYARPPLSKEVLRGDAPAESTALRTPDEYAELDVELRLGVAATALDLTARRVTLAGGTTLPYDRLVIATGATPRRLPGTEGLAGVHVLRTLDDAQALAAAFAGGPRVAVVGAGFIGGEVAASARALGLDVTLIEALPVPLARVLGAEMGAACGRLHQEHGVDLRLGVGVDAVEGDGRVERLLLSDGSTVDADVVVVGIGVVPETAWLAGSGLTLDDGVVCDDRCRAAPDVYAVGDVARWSNPLFGESMRLEHWTNASEQAVAVARALLHPDAPPYAPVPYFWSDQYDAKIQFLGMPCEGGEVRVVAGSVDEGRFVALYREQDGSTLRGVLGLRSNRAVMRLRPLLAEPTPWADAVERASA